MFCGSILPFYLSRSMIVSPASRLVLCSFLKGASSTAWYHCLFSLVCNLSVYHFGSFQFRILSVCFFVSLFHAMLRWLFAPFRFTTTFSVLSSNIHVILALQNPPVLSGNFCIWSQACNPSARRQVTGSMDMFKVMSLQIDTLSRHPTLILKLRSSEIEPGGESKGSRVRR